MEGITQRSYKFAWLFFKCILHHTSHCKTLTETVSVQIERIEILLIILHCPKYDKTIENTKRYSCQISFYISIKPSIIKTTVKHLSHHTRWAPRIHINCWPKLVIKFLKICSSAWHCVVLHDTVGLNVEVHSKSFNTHWGQLASHHQKT